MTVRPRTRLRTVTVRQLRRGATTTVRDRTFGVRTITRFLRGVVMMTFFLTTFLFGVPI
jgi:hypothetical protein